MFTAGGLVFIEWAERVASYLPTDYVEITLEVTGETSRRAIVKGGEGVESLVA